ncbi:hypothetical protein [Erythrobacter sp. F6033]|uniref:hypothetical protein n=1 Tax=Erythrobacter sp. F6033 TaxID=2926401 RepID=UPI001FF57ED6|nr:hypothetical protein [Erythrobacter sp. F6033]MCK0129318.1 hypothetical protein [Erythrobacter sp. F6033]
MNHQKISAFRAVLLTGMALTGGACTSDLDREDAQQLIEEQSLVAGTKFTMPREFIDCLEAKGQFQTKRIPQGPRNGAEVFVSRTFPGYRGWELQFYNDANWRNVEVTGVKSIGDAGATKHIEFDGELELQDATGTAFGECLTSHPVTNQSLAVAEQYDDGWRITFVGR